MDPGNPDLIEFIREKIRRAGPVSFAWFMEQALYHPQFGYYSSGRCQIGRKGDYFTNASVGPLFGRSLAAQFAEMWDLLGGPRDFVIAEQGAHHGDFALDVLTATRERRPDFFAALQYRIIEPFPILQDRQHARLSDFLGKVVWETAVGEMAPFCGVHFSNELIDAMPVHLIVRPEDNSGWKERFVDASENGFTFVAEPIANENLQRHLKKIPPPRMAPYETEVNLAALEWVESLSRKLERGFVLAVDYGYARGRYYAAERVSGTLQSRAGHRALPSPLQAIGHADITAHVDWTSIAECAAKCGLPPAGFTDQHHFVTGLLSRLAPEALEKDEPRSRRALQTLLHPELLGTRFQYLALAKDGPADQLSGFCLARDARRELEFSEAD
jgi:SAM-dependent MidA family methyltransferase